MNATETKFNIQVANEAFNKAWALEINNQSKQAVPWYYHAYLTGHKIAAFLLGIQLYCGRYTKQNIQIAEKLILLGQEYAITFLKEHARNNDRVALTYLACAYFHGFGVNKCFLKAVKLFEKAANRSMTHILNSLGYIYLHGQEGIAQDHPKAIQCFLLGAQRNDVESQLSLGSLYARGVGTTQNYSEAFKFYHAAAAQGHQIAQYRLGQLYENGYGCTKNLCEAVQWYWYSAKQKNKKAVQSLVNYNINYFHLYSQYEKSENLIRLINNISDRLVSILLIEKDNFGWTPLHYIAKNQPGKILFRCEDFFNPIEWSNYLKTLSCEGQNVMSLLRTRGGLDRHMLRYFIKSPDESLENLDGLSIDKNLELHWSTYLNFKNGVPTAFQKIRQLNLNAWPITLVMGKSLINQEWHQIKLRELYLSHCQLDDEIFLHFFEAFHRVYVLLDVLDLSNNSLSIQTLFLLTHLNRQALSKTVNLSSNHIVMHYSKLIQLNHSINIAKIKKYQRDLKEIDLSSNYCHQSLSKISGTESTSGYSIDRFGIFKMHLNLNRSFCLPFLIISKNDWIIILNNKNDTDCAALILEGLDDLGQHFIKKLYLSIEFDSCAFAQPRIDLLTPKSYSRDVNDDRYWKINRLQGQNLLNRIILQQQANTRFSISSRCDSSIRSKWALESLNYVGIFTEQSCPPKYD